MDPELQRRARARAAELGISGTAICSNGANSSSMLVIEAILLVLFGFFFNLDLAGALPGLAVVMVTGQASHQTAVAAMKAGAEDGPLSLGIGKDTNPLLMPEQLRL